MNRSRSFRESAASAKEYLSLEEIQLAIGEFSVAGAGCFLAGVSVEKGNFIRFIIGGFIGMTDFSEGRDHVNAAKEKLKQRRLVQDD